MKVKWTGVAFGDIHIQRSSGFHLILIHRRNVKNLVFTVDRVSRIYLGNHLDVGGPSPPSPTNG